MFYKIGALENFCKIDRKTPVLKSLFKVAGLKRLHHKYFSKIFAKHLRTPDNKSPYTIKNYSQEHLWVAASADKIVI